MNTIQMTAAQTSSNFNLNLTRISDKTLKMSLFAAILLCVNLLVQFA